jgi:hypothetical protein
VSLAGKDVQIAHAIMDYLRLLKAGARQRLVLKGLRMDFGGMRSAVVVSRACDRLLKNPKHQEDIEWFEYSPPRDKYDFVQPLCAQNVKTATVVNTLKATAGMFQMIGGMTQLRDLTYEGPVVTHGKDLLINGVVETLPSGQETLVAHLPDTLERLEFQGDCFSLHEFRFGYAWRDRVKAGGFPVLREVRLGSMFLSLIGLDARETLLALEGLASLRVLELGVERCEWGGGWWKVGILARAVKRFRLARPEVQVVALLEELRAASP